MIEKQTRRFWERESLRAALVMLSALFALLVVNAARSQAQQVTFTASASAVKVALGEQFQVTYTLSGGNLRNYRDFRQPSLNADFLTLMGPNTSQQMQIINGRVSSAISWSYVIQPRKPGKFTIPPANITYDGTPMASNPLTITVVTAAPPGSKGQQKGGEQQKIDPGDYIFMRALVDKREVYLGEPIHVTYKLYSRVGFNVDNIVKLPRIVGFWSEEIESPTQLQPVIETVDGKQYQAYLLKKVVYFPTQSGRLFIEPFELGCTIQVRQKRKSGDEFFDRFFSDPFFDSYKNAKLNIRSEKVAINVKALPEAEKPEFFRGAVGDYTMETTLDRTKLKANETAALKVVIRGAGNIRLLEEPVLTLPNDVERYDPRIDEEVIKGAGDFYGVKTFEYLLIPRFPGKRTIPPVRFAYFDYHKKRYVSLESKEFTLDIEKGDAVAAENNPTSMEVNYLAMDIQSLKSAAETEQGGGFGLSPTVAVGMYLLPVLAAFGGIVAKRRYDRIHGDVVGLKMRRATRMAEKHLGASKKYLDLNQADKYYLEIARALWGYIQNRLALPTSEISIDRVMQVLSAKNVAELTRNAMQRAMEGIEYARFSPTRASENEMRSLYGKAREAIIAVEQELRS